MILAGGQGSRLGVLTRNIAKPAVPYGGKYRIIDFPLTNCAQSGIDTVGILTQYKPLELNTYIGNGQAWDLDVNNGGLKAKTLENVFFACTPQTDGNDVFGEGDYLKFTVYTDTDTWVKTVNFSADRTLAFKAGRISSFSVSAHGFEKQ